MNHLKKAEDLPSRVFKGAVNMCFRSLSTDTYFFTMSYSSLSIRVKREYESKCGVHEQLQSGKKLNVLGLLWKKKCFLESSLTWSPCHYHLPMLSVPKLNLKGSQCKRTTIQRYLCVGVVVSELFQSQKKQNRGKIGTIWLL